MKRDMDLIRDLLLHIEQDNEFNEERSIEKEKLSEQNARVISAHCKLLKQAGYINKLTLASGGYILAGELTNQGYDFVDTIRDEKIWRKTKQAVDTAGGFSVRLLGRIATGFLEKKIEDATGVEISL